MRPGCWLQIARDGGEVGAADEVGLETFKKGAVLEEEQQAHALPGAQWAALEECLRTGASISRTSQVMREICDAVDHEVTKEVLTPPPHTHAAAHSQPAPMEDDMPAGTSPAHWNGTIPAAVGAAAHWLCCHLPGCGLNFGVDAWTWHARRFRSMCCSANMHGAHGFGGSVRGQTAVPCPEWSQSMLSR